MRWLFPFVALFLGSCGNDAALRVRQFHLQDTNPSQGHPFIRAEMNKRLHGAVTLEDRNLRRGNYYHVRWRGLSGDKLVKILFEYRQARTGEKINQKLITAEAAKNGEQEVVVSGRAYLTNGHVQSWKMSLFEGENLVASKQSYLWE